MCEAYVNGRCKRPNACLRFPLCMFIVLFLIGCDRHSTDAKLELVFRTHEPQFDELLAMVKVDHQIVTIMPTVIITHTKHLRVQNADLGEVEKLGLSKGRWLQYQRLLRDLRLPGGVLAGDDGSFCFKADLESLWNGDTSKGYMYSLNPLAPTVSDLDQYSPERDRFGRHRPYMAYRMIKPHWYLYFVRN